jgi:ribonuclease T1
VFGNRERRLPVRPHGYYREYTVPKPGQRDRGPRRIVTGGSERFYTADHYRSFRKVVP